MKTADYDALAKVIAENLPSPYALGDVWRQTLKGSEFDLSQGNPTTVEEWRALAKAVVDHLSGDKR
jgi:hypothetical protein